MTARNSELATAGLRTVPDPDTSRDADLRHFRSYTYSSLVGPPALLLVFFTVISGVPYPPDPLGMVELAGVAIVVVAIARLGERHIPRRPDQRPLSRQVWRAWAAVGCVGAVVIGALWVRAGEAWLWSFAPAAVVSLLIAGLSPARRRLAVPAVMLAMAGMGVAVGAWRGGQRIEGFALSGAMWTGFWLFATLASIWTWQVVVELDEARRTAAGLAVANERLRFAADLHDIQGHSLQVIALKSELARRLAKQDPTAAAAEMAAVQELAAEALDDTRTVVEGYRRANLDTEIANATNVLGSAGIDARLHVAPELDASKLEGPVRHLLGLVVREAVTNVLRHSAATRAEVALELDDRGLRLSVSNDGVDRPPTATGSGLGQLSNRLKAAGGRLTWRRTNDMFEVRAEMPLAVTPTAPDAAAPA